MTISIFLFKIFGFGQYEMNDRPSVTETDRVGVYEMDRQTNRQKSEMPLKLIKFLKIFFTGTRICYYI